MALTDADMVEFDEAGVHDLPVVAALLAQGVPADDGEQRWLPWLVEAFPDLAADPHQTIVVGRFGGGVVSCLWLRISAGPTPADARVARIDHVRVRSDMWDRGIGYVMLWWAIERARSRGCSLVQVSDDVGSGCLETLGRKHGFETALGVMELRLDDD